MVSFEIRNDTNKLIEEGIEALNPYLEILEELISAGANPRTLHDGQFLLDQL